MKAKELIIIGLAGVMIFTGAVQIAAESQSDEQLTKFYETYISEKIAKSQSKTTLKTSRSENLRLAAEKAEKQVRFLTLNKDILVDEMIKQDIGQRPYKIDKYLNKRFSDYSDCLRLGESNYLTSINTGLQLMCN
jgi:hypothetical protein